MSDEEHLIENLISYVQSVGWSEASELVNLNKIYKRCYVEEMYYQFTTTTQVNIVTILKQTIKA